jgi:glycosyltransferase involved in cell wall biosynthesis
MRILHTCQYFLPWLGYQEFYLAREQVRAGHEVLVVSSNLLIPLDARYAKALSARERESKPGRKLEYGIASHRLPVRARVRGRLVLEGLQGVVRDFRPDVVHSHGYLVPLTFQVAATRPRSFRFVVDEHQLAQQANPARAHVVQRNVGAWIAREWLIHGYGCPPELVNRVIPLGADTEVFRPDADAGRRVRAELGVGSDELVVLYTGKIAAHKRIDLLIHSLGRLVAATPATLVVIGDADSAVRSRLIDLAAALKVRLIVRDAVPPQQLAAYFNAADVCAWPSDCTVSHLEAAACGKPILIPARSGVEDRIAADNGVAVATGDLDSLTETLAHLLRSRDLRLRMGANGRRLMVERYSWPSIAAEFEALYRRDVTSELDC